jgi:UDP-N-acetylmuramoyl-L-alanyl-D-glutamate--2,6-diaminopimelate ligase
MKLSNLLESIYPISLPFDLNVPSIALDSRLVEKGGLFFAFPGTQLDGRKYIDDAISKGAEVVFIDANKGEKEYTIIFSPIPVLTIPNLRNTVGELASRFYDHPTQSLKIIGVTGTSGKTSTSHFLASALTDLSQPCGVIGTLGNGLYGHIKESNLTTPDAVTLQKTFAELLGQGAKAVSMEVSSHSLDQGRVNSVEFEIGIFTNLSHDHLDYHHTLEEYFAAKKKLFSQTKNAVINVEDQYGRQLLNDLEISKNTFAYSTHFIKDIKCPFTYAKDVRLDHSGISAEIISPWGKGKLTSSLIGNFNLSNFLAVINSLCLLDIPFEQALASISKFHSVPGRMQMFGGSKQPLVVVDYAHKPDALEKVLLALKHHTSGKLHCVFGCGGERDTAKRPVMAEIVEKYADQIIVTNDNPRNEDPNKIIAEIIKGFKNSKKIIVQQDRSKAIEEAIQCAAAGDCILIAGKGAETYQQIGNEKLPFSDIKKVQDVLRGV